MDCCKYNHLVLLLSPYHIYHTVAYLGGGGELDDARCPLYSPLAWREFFLNNFGSDLLLLFKQREVWSVDSQ